MKYFFSAHVYRVFAVVGIILVVVVGPSSMHAPHTAVDVVYASGTGMTSGGGGGGGGDHVVGQGGSGQTTQAFQDSVIYTGTDGYTYEDRYGVTSNGTPFENTTCLNCGSSNNSGGGSSGGTNTSGPGGTYTPNPTTDPGCGAVSFSSGVSKPCPIVTTPTDPNTPGGPGGYDLGGSLDLFDFTDGENLDIVVLDGIPTLKPTNPDTITFAIPPVSFTAFSAHPSLINPQSTANRVTTVSWDTQHAKTCKVTSNNSPDVWEGTTTQSRVSLPITAQTTFILTCVGDDAIVYSTSTLVNIVPTFQER